MRLMTGTGCNCANSDRAHRLARTTRRGNQIPRIFRPPDRISAVLIAPPDEPGTSVLARAVRPLRRKSVGCAPLPGNWPEPRPSRPVSEFRNHSRTSWQERGRRADIPSSLDGRCASLVFAGRRATPKRRMAPRLATTRLEGKNLLAILQRTDSLRRRQSTRR